MGIPQTSKRRGTLDPIVTLLHPDTSAITLTSLCFLHRTNSNRSTVFVTRTTEVSTQDSTRGDNYEDIECGVSDDESNDSSSVQLQCTSLLQHHHKRDDGSIVNRNNNNMNTTIHDDGCDALLSRRLLASCDSNGECYIWDVGCRRVIHQMKSTPQHGGCGGGNGKNHSRTGPGLSLRRISNDYDCSNSETTEYNTGSRFFYQTRDAEGTISLHDTNTFQSIQTLHCHSQSFCCASPSDNNSNLIVMPCFEHSYAMVRDWRISSLHHPVAYFHAGTGIAILDDDDDNDDDSDNDIEYVRNINTVKKYGMLTSLAMSTTMNGATTMIACGMENGSIVYHDLSMIVQKHTNSKYRCYEPYSISLGTDPILALDMVPSKATSSNNNSGSNSSFVTVAGLSGNEDDLLNLPENDRGRVVLLKSNTDANGICQARVRSRISTINTKTTSIRELAVIESSSIQGKPGIGQCRIRPGDGRLFAVGGWDKRVRIYDRKRIDAPLAILRGHAESVNAIDWSDDAMKTGLLATGSSDGKIHIWRCFPSNTLRPVTERIERF